VIQFPSTSDLIVVIYASRNLITHSYAQVLKLQILATNTRKQSAVTFKVFVLWLPNQHYYTCDSIGIKMTYRDLRYYEDIRAKTRRECKLHENKHENHANHLHTFRKWSTTWSQFVLWSTCSKHWLIHHSMVCTAIYSSHDSNIIKYARIAEVWRKPVAVFRCFISSKPLLLQWLFNLPMNCLMHSLTLFYLNYIYKTTKTAITKTIKICMIYVWNVWGPCFTER